MANMNILSLHDCQKEILSAYATPINYSWTLLSIPIGAFLPQILWTWLLKVPLSILSSFAVLLLVPMFNVGLYLYHLISMLSFPPSSYLYDTATMCKTTYSYIVLNIDTLIKREHILTSAVLGSSVCFIVAYLYIDYMNQQIYLKGNIVIQEAIDHNVRLFTRLRTRSNSRNRLRIR